MIVARDIYKKTEFGGRFHSGAPLNFVSTLPAANRDDLERLFFFNPLQTPLLSQIKSVVEETGVPFIVEHQDRIWIDVPSGRLQCLFVCGSAAQLVGAALFGRPARDLLWIYHLAVDPEYTLVKSSDSALSGIIVNKILEIARRINGVTRIKLPYRRSGFLHVRGRE